MIIRTAIVLTLATGLLIHPLCASEKDDQAKDETEKKVELKTSPKDICLHFMELLQKGDLQNCLRYVKHSEKDNFEKSFVSLGNELKEMKITFIKQVQKSDDECEVHLQFIKPASESNTEQTSEDDVSLELVNGVWKIVTM